MTYQYNCTLPMQVWATLLFFALLIDLGDAVAEELMLPFCLSLKL